MSGVLDQPIIIEMSARGSTGPQGETGNGIASIAKTGETVLVDHYTITYTDGTTTTFDVTNGKGITSIVNTSSTGLVDHYTITYNDGTTQVYDVENGNGIESYEKTGTDVLVDHYLITFTNGQTKTIDITNGNGIASISKTGTNVLTDTYTISYTNGTTATFDVVNGNGISTVTKTGSTSLTDHYRIDFTNGTYTTYDVANGKGIVSIEKTGTAGLVDTYTVTYNDSTTSTFTVTNGAKGDTGNGIASITKTGTSGLVDTYTVTMTDSTTTTFTVTNGAKGDTGNGIASIAKTGTVGAVDTYTITMTDGTTTTFTVTNGSDTWGAIVGTLSDQTDLQDALDEKAVAISESASGSIVSIDDGTATPVSALTANIEPVQDLNGYDNPWPAGGGANQWDEQWEVGSISTSNGGNISSTTEIRSTNYIPVLPETAYYFKSTTTAGSASFYYYDANKTYLGYTSGNSRNHTFTTMSGAHFMRFKEGASYGTTYNNDIAVNYPSSVTTYAPYSNICPISGHTQAVVTRTGKNLLNPVNVVDGIFNSSYDMKIEPTTGGACVYCPIKGGQTYTISKVQSARFVVGVTETLPANNVALTYVKGNNSATSLTIPTSANDKYLNIFFYLSSADTLTQAEILASIQVEVGSSTSSYSAYSGTSVTIDLGGTRYGGTLDVLTGTLTVTYGIETLGSAPSGSWGSFSSGLGGYLHTVDAMAKGNAQAGYADWLPTITNFYDNQTGIQFGSGANSNTIYLAGMNDLLGVTDKASFLAYLAEHPLTICYPLLTPQTYTLTAQQLSLLAGDNVVWADTGDVSLTYRADTKTYIADTVTEQQGIIGSVEVGTASRNFSVNEFLVMNNVLYKVIANIGSGSAITVGTNVVATTIAEQLTALLNA